MKKHIRRFVLSIVVAIAAFLPVTVPAADPVAIYSAHVDAAAGTLTINGQNFGTNVAGAWLGSAPLAIQSWSPTQIVGTVPVLAAGSYLVTVSKGNSPNQNAQLVVEIGAGRIIGMVSACGTSVARTLAYVPGRSFLAFTDNNGAFMLENVPAGTYNMVLETPGQAAKTLSDVVVSAGHTTNIGTTNVVDLSGNPNNCGACGNACQAGQSCVSGVCQGTVPTGCNATNCPTGCCLNNTCVAGNTASACGAGGGACVSCSFPNANSACVSGSCAIASCNAGFSNCDGNIANGCETLGQCLPLSCFADAQCPSTHFCAPSGSCFAKQLTGAMCNTNSQCISGVCTNLRCL